MTSLENKGAIDHTRQRDIFDPTKYPYAKVTLVGGGGIGSATALTLAKLGVPSLTIIDFDVVEPHNVPNQFFSLSQGAKNTPKVEALAEMCEEFGAAKVKAVHKKFQDAKPEVDGIVVSALDSMSAREDLWGMVRYNPGVETLVCARIGGQDIVIWCIDPKDPDDVKIYENTALFSDEEGVELPCTARGIFDVSSMVAGFVGRQVRRIIVEQSVERLITYNHEELSIYKRR